MFNLYRNPSGFHRPSREDTKKKGPSSGLAPCLSRFCLRSGYGRFVEELGAGGLGSERARHCLDRREGGTRDRHLILGGR